MQILKRISYFGSLLLLAYMPFHIFLSQSLSLITGGLEEWKIAKDVLLVALCVFTICLVFLQGRATRLFKILLLFTVAYGLLHLGIWAAHPDLYQRTAMLGTIYNVRLALYAILGAGAVLLWPKFAFSSVIKLVLIASTAVAGLGILQYFLPSDFLTHFGYSLSRGVRPAFFIDDNPLFPRIMSTLREPNALGAYLILPTTILGLLAFQMRDLKKRVLLAGLFGLHLAAIFLTQSRSAWAAVVVSLGLAFFWQHRTWLTLVVRRFWYIGAALVVVAVSGAYLLRDSHFVQGYIVHTSTARTSNINSNNYHALLVRQGLEGILHQPLGHGPGTAGLVSIQNPNGGQLTENYYVQIGYEIGVIGAVLFIAANVWLYIQLWRRKNYIGVAMCASFWAYVVTNMLLHTWSNEAVVAQWWILAGMVASGATDQRASTTPTADV
jgi:O-antigen ligase